MTANPEIVIALGANLPSKRGDPARTLTAALEMMTSEDIEVTARSRWYETPAWPAGSGPDYVNGAALLRTTLAPDALLGRLHEIEDALGRRRTARFGPRVCDLDLLAYGDIVLPDAEAWRAAAEGPTAILPETLILPHPRLHTRAFALGPMLDVAPDWRHPVLGATARALYDALPEADCAAIRQKAAKPA